MYKDLRLVSLLVWAGVPGIIDDLSRVPSLQGALCTNMAAWGEPPARMDRAPLIALPDSYADLHLAQSQAAKPGGGPGEEPPQAKSSALCLVCNTLLSAGKKVHGGIGECTMHARKCGGGNGMVFLVYECAVILIAGKRAARFPSPYVDAFGESPNAHQRRRPLARDDRIYGALGDLWEGHQVAAEVSRLRDSSERLIRDNYY